MAALLPTPSSDRDPGSRQETWPTAAAHQPQQDLLSNFTLDHRERAAEGKGCVRMSFLFSPFSSVCLFICSSLPFSLLSLSFSFLISPIFPLPLLHPTFIPFSSSFLSFFASSAPEPHLAHLPAPTSCAIPVVCSGLGEGQTWQNRWIPGEAAEPMGSHPIPSSRGCTGE